MSSSVLVKKNGSPLNILILVANDIVCDGRVNKTAQALIDAGANVTVLGQSITPEMALEKLKNKPYRSFVLQSEIGVKQPRLGKEDVPRWIRIPVNLTVTKFRELIYLYKRKDINNTFKYLNFDIDTFLRDNSFDIVQANDVYTLQDGFEISRKAHIPLIVDLYELFDGYFLKEKRGEKLQQVSDSIEQKYLPRAKHVFTVAPSIESYLKQKYHLSSTSVLLNSPYKVDVQATPVHHPVKILEQCFLRPAAGSALILETMPYLRGKATLTYQGRAHSPEFFNYLRDRARALQVEDCVTFLGPYDAEESIKLAQDYDIGVILHRPANKSKDMALANRLFTYMNAGLAVVASDTSGHREFPHFFEFGRTVKLENKDCATHSEEGKKIAEVISSLIDDPAKLNDMKRSAQKYCAEYSFDEQAAQYIETVKRVFLSSGQGE